MIYDTHLNELFDSLPKNYLKQLDSKLIPAQEEAYVYNAEKSEGLTEISEDLASNGEEIVSIIIDDAYQVAMLSYGQSYLMVLTGDEEIEEIGNGLILGMANSVQGLFIAMATIYDYVKAEILPISLIMGEENNDNNNNNDNNDGEK